VGHRRPHRLAPGGDPGRQRRHRAGTGLAHRRRGDREARRRRQAGPALVGRQPRGRPPAPRAPAGWRPGRVLAARVRPRRLPPALVRSCGHGEAAAAPLARRVGLHRRGGHRAAARRRVRRAQRRPRQRRGALAAPVPRPPGADRHLLDLLGPEPGLGRHRRGAHRRLADGRSRQARAAAADDPPPTHGFGAGGALKPSNPRPSKAPGLKTDPRPDGEIGLKAAIVVEDWWESGWCGHLEITGDDAANLSAATIGFTLPAGTRITQSWNGDFSAAEGRVRVRLPAWARAPMTASGFCVSGTGVATDVTIG
jgi:hypothetical protein